MEQENLGPAEKIISTLTSYADHLFHGRPGLVVADNRLNVGVRWEYVTHRVENGQKVVYRLTKSGKKTVEIRAGVIQNDNRVVENGRLVGSYHEAGLFPEIATWMYQQVADVWKLDNEFAAHWASYAYTQDHKDLKVVLAAFMLCQSRRGDPVLDNGKVAFYDEDFRDIGEAMMLHVRKDNKDMSPKLLLRIHDFLQLPQVVKINHDLGFSRSARKTNCKRWKKAVHKWLQFREDNPKMLEGLVKAGFRTTVLRLAQLSGYKPESPKFFDILRWKQKQAQDGHRQISIGKEVCAAETWEGLTETQVCEQIVRGKPNFKRIVGLVPKNVGLTRAVVAAAIESGSFSDKELIIFTPTLEDLGLLQVQDIRERWEKAVKNAEDTRAANIALRVRSKETKEKLQEAADTAVKAAVEEVTKNLRVYFMVDISGSMESAIVTAKSHVAKFLQGFPQDKIHVSVFNTSGREIKIPHASAAGVENAFRGISAGGGTDYGSGVKALQAYKPKDDEESLFIFVGDEEATSFERAVQTSGLNPMAFGFVRVGGSTHGGLMTGGRAVRETAAALKIPCFMIDERTFEDPYAIPRTIRALVAATPVGQVPGRVAPTPRVSLVEMILKTELLRKPTWAD